MNNGLILPRCRNTSLSFAMAPIYSAAIEMVTLLQKWYAELLYTMAKAAITEKQQDKIDARNQILLVSASSTSCQDDDAFIYSVDSIDSNVSSDHQLNDAS